GRSAYRAGASGWCAGGLRRAARLQLLEELRRRLAGALALGVLGAAEEVAAAAPAVRLAQDHRPAALRTGLAHLDLGQFLLRPGRHERLGLLLELLRHRLGAAALRVGAAAQKRAARPAADEHRRAALLALDARVQRLHR